MKPWRAMSGGQIAKIVSSFSCLALFLLVQAGESYRDLQRDLARPNADKEIQRIFARYPNLLAQDGDLADAVEYFDDEYSLKDLQSLVEIRAVSEEAVDPGIQAKAKAVKASPLYRDPGIQDKSNWLDGAMKRLRDLLKRSPNSPNVNLPNAAMPGWIIPGFWILLGLAVLVFAYFALRHFQWKGALRRKAKAVLEDDEPDRTLDEWLTMADQYAAEGKYREAVRAMYLSCLLKFDEAGVARFVRGETNWEHLRRIQASPKRPEPLTFLEPTQAFDRIWYGFHVNGVSDYEQFRFWYQSVTDALTAVKR